MGVSPSFIVYEVKLVKGLKPFFINMHDDSIRSHTYLYEYCLWSKFTRNRNDTIRIGVLIQNG